ncbi:MAG: Tim44 domain-containing protein [Rubrivivax sp.]|nr:Tim44 domain-containing protein [Rubrivivax sp.]
MLSGLRGLRGRLAAGRRRQAALPSPGDVDAFLDVARRSFVCVQQAWDRADLAALAAFATEPLFEELRSQLAERGAQPNHTEVIRIEARLLGVENLREAQVASVEFSGLIREQHDARPMPFRELWMLARLQGVDPGWRVARVQALS